VAELGVHNAPSKNKHGAPLAPGDAPRGAARQQAAAMSAPRYRPPRLPSVAERVGWLFEVITTRVAETQTGGDREPRWRQFSTAEVARALTVGLAQADFDSSVAALARLRAGQPEDGCDLAAVAEFFGAPPDYFGDDPSLVEEAQDVLLSRALNDCEVRTYRLCRSPILTAARRRELLRRGLDIVRLRSVATSEHRNQAAIVDSATTASQPWNDQDATTSPERGGRGVRSIEGEGETSVQSPRSEAELLAMCQRLLLDLDILPPLTPEILCEKLGAARGRRLKLVAGELNTTSSVGHLISKARRDVIAYQRSAPRPQQAHVIYHEVMHLVCGHLDHADSLTCGALEADGDTGENDGLYARWQEWEAETGATILSELSRQRPDPRLITRDSTQAQRGIAATFGLSSGGWRR
jgi:hypothetical protein